MKIFISSTFRDLQSEREIIIKSLNKAGFSASGMELFVSEPQKSKDVCLRELNNSDLVLLITGSRYGTIDPETKLSYTHLEFREARRSNKPILAFLFKGTSFLDFSLIREAKRLISSDYKAIIDFRNEIKEQPITVDFFSNKNQLLGIIWPSLYKYFVKNGLLSRPVRTFQTFAEFYGFYQTQQYLFNYTHKLIGREKEVQELANFVKDDNKYIAIVSGIGGIGKSKLIYDFSSSYMAENDDFEFRYLSSQIEYIDLDTIKELPAKNVCLVVEDAHRRNDLDKILYTFLSLSNSPYKTKLIFSTRPSGLDKLKSALANYPNEITSFLPLDYLTKENAKLLAESVLGEQGDTIERLIAISNRNTLVLIMAAQLLKEKKISGSLIKEPDFVNKVLKKLLDEVKQIGQVEGIYLSQLLTLFSGISPFNPNSIDTQNTLSNIFAKAEWFRISKAIEKLVNLGYLLKRGNTLRVVPDVLSDYIFFSKAIDSRGQSTKFVDYLFEYFSKEYFGNILQNTAEVEYGLIKNEEGRTLLNNVWGEIFEKIKIATNHSELVNILNELKRAAFFSPSKVFEITKWIIDNSKLLQDKPENTDIMDNSQWIIESMTPLLKIISCHGNYTKDVCNILWGLANNKFGNIRTNSHPSHPFRVLSEMASLDDRNYYSVVHDTIDAIKEIISRKEHLNCYYDIQEIIESILKPEIEYNKSTIRAITISWFCVFDVSQNDLDRIKEIRGKVFGLIDILLNDDNAKSLRRTAQLLVGKIEEPYVRGQLTASAKSEFVREGEKALKLLQKIFESHKYDSLNYFIYTQLTSKESRLPNEFRQLVEGVVSSYKPSFKDEIMYLIAHDWPEYNPDEELQKTEENFHKRHKEYAEIVVLPVKQQKS